MTALVLVEHPVGHGPFSDFDSWKQTFDSDPLDRRGHGVRQHWIYRSPEADYVVIGLEFASLDEATAFKEALDAALGSVWAQTGVEGSAARVLEQSELIEY